MSVKSIFLKREILISNKIVITEINKISIVVEECLFMEYLFIWYITKMLEIPQPKRNIR